MKLRCEIIRILNDSSLIDSESYERRYRTRDGNPLVPGCYIVLWNESVATPAFDENATYAGPYKSSLVASRMLNDFLGSTPGDGATTTTGGAQPDQARGLI